MKVQTKVLLLLFCVTVTFVGGLIAFHLTEHAKYRRLAERRAEERDRNFSEFLKERGDRLNVVVEDYSIWDDMVRALVKADAPWTEANVREETLTTYGLNAVWVYRPDRTLFYSLNNRYAENLKDLPVPPEAFDKLFAGSHTCHFFVQVPQGWMEIRGATIHPSHDRFRETKPQGYFFAGQVWITDYLRRIAQFTEYSMRIVPANESETPPKSAEELGRISFSRLVPGWDGQPVARIVAEHDSPLIRELNLSSEKLMRSLLWFAAIMLVLLGAALLFWVRRPLTMLTRSLERGDVRGLSKLRQRPDEFGLLAEQMIAFRETEEQLHAAEDQLRHAQKLEAVGRLAGGVAHDFNNLLTAIIGYSQLLERKLAHDPVGLEQIRLVFRAGEQAAGLTRQLLAFSRKQMLEPKVIDLNSLVREVEKLLRRVIGEHIHLIIETNADEARVLADPGQVEQVLLNLGVNARDAMPGGGTLIFRTGNTDIDEEGARSRGGDIAPGKYVCLSVCDSGAGMDAATKARIFEPFFTTKGPGRGTGLGLATVYGIVKQSQGAITVESEPGKGSTFCIELPQVESQVTPAAPAPAPVIPAQRAETILAVEDEEVVRMVICSVLEHAGYRVVCAATPEEALALATVRGGGIQLLLTDVVMPGMTGPVLASKIVGMYPAMRVLYISGYSERDMVEQGITEGEIEVLQKPFTHQSLVHRVREVLSETRTPVKAAD